MNSYRTFLITSAIVLVVLVLATGCSWPSKTAAGKPEKPLVTEIKPKPEKPRPSIELALKFAVGDVSTYKVTTEATKSVLWEGPEQTKPSAFKGGYTSNRIELTFDQEIRSIAENGNAVAEVTIKQLKYLAKVRDNVIVDFDSSRDQDSPLQKLIGRSYSIEITPAGQVPKVTKVAEVLSDIKGSTSAQRAARELLSDQTVKQRHSIPALPAVGKSRPNKGDSWRNLKSFDFGMMGTKSYERVYQFEGVHESSKGRVAVVVMNAVPSTGNAAKPANEQAAGFLSKLFDNTEEYTGRLQMNLDRGKVDQYTEELKSEWVAVDPESVQKDDQEPAILRMTAVHFYQIVRID